MVTVRTFHRVVLIIRFHFRPRRIFPRSGNASPPRAKITLYNQLLGGRKLFRYRMTRDIVIAFTRLTRHCAESRRNPSPNVRRCRCRISFSCSCIPAVKSNITQGSIHLRNALAVYVKRLRVFLEKLRFSKLYVGDP